VDPADVDGFIHRHGAALAALVAQVLRARGGERPDTAEDFAAMGPLGRLRHRFEWSWAGAGAYYIRAVWMSKMMTGAPPARRRKATRRDRLGVYAFSVTLGTIPGVICWGPTGPESGTSFCSNTSSTVCPPISGRYTNWASGEPNNYGTGEGCGQIYFANAGKWNHLA